MTQVNVSLFNGVNDRQGGVVSIETVRERILTGANGLDEKTRYLNVLAQTEPETYKKEKEKLQAFTPSGTFPPYKRKAKHLLAHSAHIILDIDGLPPEQIPDLLAELAQMPHVVLAFVSPSGTGIKVLVRVDPIPHNDREHKGAYQACLEFFEDLASEYSFEIDTSGKDCSRMCFLAHDPLAIFHIDTPAIDWNKESWIQEQIEQQKRFEAAAKKAYTGEADVEALNYIDPNDLKYEQWLSVITACKQAGLSWQQTDVWSQRGGVRYEHGEVESRWDGLNLDISWGAVVNLAKLNGYTPPPRAKRYTSNKDYVHTTSDIDTERNENKNELLKWVEHTENAKGKHALILGSAAGTGKTTTGITTVEQFVYVAKTSDEADKVYEALFDQEEDTIRHRSRMFNYNHPDWETLPLGLADDERPCINPILCNEHAAKLGSPNEVCHRCPLFAECQKNAYLSQAEKERNTSKVVYSWNESFICDSTLASRLKRICTKDKIFILDEANPLGFTQLRKLNRDMIYDLCERFRHALGTDHEIYQTLKGLLDLISTAEKPDDFITGLSEWILMIEDIDDLDTKLGKFPVSITFRKSPETAEHNQHFVAQVRYSGNEVIVPVVDFETGDDTPVFLIDTEEQITLDTPETRFMSYGFLLKVGLASLSEPPHRYRFVKDIQTFLNENRVIDAAPFTFDAKEQSLEFHLKPTLNHRRVIVNTASDPDCLIEEAYRETGVQITRHDGTPPAWKTDLVFQIASGAYLPRHSLLAKDGKKLVLKKYAEDMIESFIKPSIQAGLKTLVIAPKAFQEVESVREWAVTDPDDYRVSENAILTNHHRAEGRNDYQDCDIVFEFHYEPNHNEIQADAKHLYRNPDTPLDFTREKQTVSVNGVEFKKTVYTDNRVQTVYNRECRSRLMQGPMRLRPNIHEGKTIVFLTAEPIDIPVTPVPFTPRDKDKFNGNWADFKEALQAKADAIESGDVQAVMEATGQSESTARRKTKASRDRKNAERDAQIIALHEQGKSYREIHTETGVSLGTVSNVVKAYKNSQNAIDSTYSSLTETVHPIYTDVPCVESETPHNCEVKQLSQTFPHLLQIGTLFFGKYELTAAEISQHTGYDESQVKNILESWYTNVCISKGLGESYWMSERDRGKFESEIIAPLQAKWESMPGHITTSEPIPENLQKRLREYSLQG